MSVRDPNDPPDLKKYRVWVRFIGVKPPENLGTQIQEMGGEILSRADETFYIRFMEHKQLEPFCKGMQEWLGQNYSVKLWFPGCNFVSTMGSETLRAEIICNLDCSEKK